MSAAKGGKKNAKKGKAGIIEGSAAEPLLSPDDDLASDAAALNPSPQSATGNGESPPPNSAAAAAADDGTSAEELAQRRLMVSNLEGHLKPDQAAFAQAVQQAEQAKAKLMARASAGGGTPKPTGAFPSPPLSNSASTSIFHDSSVTSVSSGGVTDALKGARLPSLTRQPSAPETTHRVDAAAAAAAAAASASVSPPRDSSMQQHTHTHTHHVSFAPQTTTFPSTSALLTASPAFGPRHQSLPDLASLGGDANDSFQLNNGDGSIGLNGQSGGPSQFDHLSQRPSAELFGASRRPTPPRKGSNALREPLLSIDPSQPHSHNPSGSPDAQAALAQEQSLQRDQALKLADHSKGLGRRQLRAMLRKNWLLKIRNPGQFLCEVVSPLMMVMVIVGGWIFSLKHIEEYQDERFANQTGEVEEIFQWVNQHIVPIPPPIPPTTLYSLGEQTWMGREALREEEQLHTTPLQALYSSSYDVDAVPDVHELDSDALAPTSPSAPGSDFSFFSALQSESRLRTLHSSSSSRSVVAATTPAPPPPGQTCYPLAPLPGMQFCYNEQSDPQDLVEKMLFFSGPTHVPRFDEFVSAHLVLQFLLNNTAAPSNLDVDRLDQFTNGRLANIIFLGKLLFTPDTPQVRQLVDQMNRTYALFHRVFTGVEQSEESALARSQKNLHTDSDRTWAILVFNSLDLASGQLDLTIRMNSSVLPTTNSIVDRFTQGIDDDFKKYYWSGFLTLQTAVEEMALNVSSGGKRGTGLNSDAEAIKAAWRIQPQFSARRRSASRGGPLSASDLPLVPNPRFAATQQIMGIPFPTLAYKGNSFYSTVGPLVGLVFCMSMLYPTSRLIKGIVEEKETKTKETMKMMGLKDWVFQMSWFLTFFAQFLVTLTLLVILLHFTVLPHTSISLLWVFFLCFGLSEITLGFLMTVFFSKAKLAGILGPILLFAATMPRYAFYSADSTNSASESTILAKTFVSVLSPTVFTFGADLLMQYEGANLHFSWSNLDDDPFSMARVLGFLLGDFLLYALLAWYLDHVLPNEYGGRMSVFFCCQRSYWQDKVQLDDDGGDEGDETEEASRAAGGGKQQGPLCEPMPSSMHSRARVRIKKLRKQFTEGRGSDKRTTIAVAGLDLTLYEDQITVLLGHNGAGKTTTISMLTGLTTPSAGDCTIHGYSILHHMKQIRKSLGICPQHNVLFAKMTVKEHLILYGTLKGVKDDQLEEEVERKIVEVGLQAKRDIYSSALSGGMQRKLQCAMAFIGDSKTVFLDEPTSGMDPYSRRSMWELLRNAKKGRVIVLTTHFMDEADLLGDRIAIMSEGRLRCVGSSLFLKAKYGIGYNLTLVKASKSCRMDQVSKMVMFFCPEARVLSTAGGEMSFRLPWTSVSAFPGLFQQLEERRQHMGVGGYGISSTTMEEVFMRCAHLATHPDNTADDLDKSVGAAARRNSISSAVAPSQSKNAPSRSVSRKTSNALPPPHPTSTSSPLKDTSDDVLSPLQSSASSLSDSPAPAGAAAGFPTQRFHPTLYMQLRATLIKRYTCAKRDLMGRFFEVVLPVVVVALVLLILKLNKPSQGKNLLFKAELYSDPYGVKPVTPLWINPAMTVLEPSTTYSLAHARGRPAGASLFDLVAKANLTDSVAMTDALLDTANSHTGARYGSFLMNDTLYSHFNTTGSYFPFQLFDLHPPLTLMHNTTFFHCLPVLVAEIAQARWNGNRWKAGAEIDPSTLSQVNYQLRNHPLPLTANESLKTQTYLTLFAALFMLIPFCYLPASFVLFVVKERSVKSKHLQFVSGLNPFIYWAGTLLWDLLQYSVIVVSVMVVMLAFQSDQFVGTVEAFGATTLLLLLYGLSAIPLCYCYSFAFGNYTSAQVGIAGLNFLTGFLLVIASFMLDQIGSTKEANITLKGFYRLFPTYSLGEGLIQLSTRDFQAFIHGQPKPSPFAWGVAGQNLFYMFIETLAYSLLTLALESNFLHRLVRMLFNYSGEMADPGPETVKDEDEDVAAERRRVQHMRVKMIRTNSEGLMSVVGLSSPVTPGYGLRSVQSKETENGSYQPPQWGTSLNSASEPSSVITSPHRDMPSSSPKIILPMSSSLNSDHVGLRSPLLGAAERNSTQINSHAWPVSPRGVELTPPGDHTPHEQKDASARSPNSGSSGNHDVTPDDDILVLQHVRKVYPARGGGNVTVAVDNLSLGIPRGQVFGFLGINGAGKTTTMKMLTGDIPMSKGRAFVNGYSIVKELSAVRKEIGYCPQFDPLLDLMTSREQISMYARFHGLPEESIPDVVQKMLNTLGLSRFADKQCGTYSGGNKRKLSLAIALIGNPRDEPSTGMDPVSRRFMWSVIESISDGRSVILTTHSMEECESLCSRVGIMAAGALQCLGSIQHLKSRFGSGYLMEVNTSEDRVADVNAFVQRLSPHSTLEQAHAGRLKYRLPQQGLTLSSVFSSMEQNKKALEVKDWSVSQCSLESIFIEQVTKPDRLKGVVPGASP